MLRIAFGVRLILFATSSIDRFTNSSRTVSSWDSVQRLWSFSPFIPRWIISRQQASLGRPVWRWRRTASCSSLLPDRTLACAVIARASELHSPDRSDNLGRVAISASTIDLLLTEKGIIEASVKILRAI